MGVMVMSERSKILNGRVGICAFGMGLITGFDSGFEAAGSISSYLQSTFGLSSAMAGLPPTIATSSMGLLGGSFFGDMAKENIKKDDGLSNTYIGSYFSGLCIGAAIGSSVKYCMANPNMASRVEGVLFSVASGASLVNVACYANEKLNLSDKLVNKIRTKVNEFLSNDKDKSKEITQEKAIDRNKEQKQELEGNKIAQSKEVSLRDTLSKSQKGLVHVIEEWAEKNHIVDKDGNLLKLNESLTNSVDAMNDLVAKAKENGFVIKSVNTLTSKVNSKEMSNEIDSR